VCDAPSPYNGFLFRSLSEQLDADLTVHFIRPTPDTHPWRSPSVEGFKSVRFDRTVLADWAFVRLAMRSRDAVFVIGGWYEPTTQLALSLARGPLILWSDTPNLATRRHPVKAFLRGAWLRWVFGRVSYVMGTGRPALDALGRMGCPPEKLVNFPYWVDIEEFRPPEATGPRDPVFVSSGRLHPNKGFDVALRALATVHRGTGIDFRYRIAGVGPAQSSLEALASDLKIRDRVEFVGWVDSGDLPAFYRTGTIFLHPARAEPYGVSILEAMASGLPVLASDATAAAVDRIDPCVNGFLHRVADADMLADQIQRILKSPATIGSMGTHARQTAEQWPIHRAVATLNTLLATL
jgi:glycosyltransferase involved in cell wall biosynthesis